MLRAAMPTTHRRTIALLPKPCDRGHGRIFRKIAASFWPSNLSLLSGLIVVVVCLVGLPVAEAQTQVGAPVAQVIPVDSVRAGSFSSLPGAAPASYPVLSPSASVPTVTARWRPAPHASPHDRGSRLWVISTREAPSAVPPAVGVETLRYWRHQPHAGWFDASLRELIATTRSSQPTLVWVHGNRIDVDDVMPQAIDLLRQLDAYSRGRSFRLIVWSWPSGRIPGPLADVRIKATRSECQSFFLAAVLAGLPPDTPVGLIGFSYGARLISGSLHLLGGGTIEGVGLAMPADTSATPRRRAVLMAAALDHDWLLRGHRYERAVDAVEGMLVFANPIDPVLRFYPLLYPGADDPQALGAVGLAAPPGAPERAKLYQIDASRVLGPVHSFRRYIHAPQIISRTADYVLFN